MKNLNKKENDSIKHVDENTDNGEASGGYSSGRNPNSPNKKRKMDLPTKVAIGIGIVLVVGIVLALIF